MEYVMSRDGTRIAFRRSGSGPPLILVHGVAGDHSRWNPLAAFLEEHFTLYAMDRRGRGESGDAAEHSLEREADDVVAVADSIDQPVSLYGHSYGATAALEAAPRIRHLRSLALYEPNSPVDPDCIERVQTLIDQGDLEEALVEFLTVEIQMSAEELDSFRRLPSWSGRVAATASLARELSAENAYRVDKPRFAGMHAPTLMLLGENSPQEAKEATHRVNAALPNCSIQLLPGQDHLADFLAPELVAQALSSFLVEHENRSAPLG